MKKITLIMLLIFGTITCFGQKVSLTLVQNKSLKSILCNVDTVLFRRGPSTSAILYQISNASGSAHIPETEESTNKFLIAVTDGDVVPDQILYSVGDFYNPKILKFQTLMHDKYLLTIEYGIFKHRKKISLDINVNSVRIVHGK